MEIVQANVPLAHLATAVGTPNHLLVEYGTDLILPVPGPYLVTQRSQTGSTRRGS